MDPITLGLIAFGILGLAGSKVLDKFAEHIQEAEELAKEDKIQQYRIDRHIQILEKEKTEAQAIYNKYVAEGDTVMPKLVRQSIDGADKAIENLKNKRNH